MNVLIAYDGSDRARIVLECAAEMRWPSGTVLHLVQVVPALQLDPVAGVTSGSASVELPVTTNLALAAEALVRPGVLVRPRMLAANDTSARLIAEADVIGAALIVVGHRGYGPLATVLLGSVARDVTEHARCPVLVVRRPGVEHVVLADDGSDAAYQARRFLARSPLFRGARVRVLSVAEMMQTMMSGVAPTMRDAVRATQRQLESDEYRTHERLAEMASHDLRLAGMHPSVDVRVGDPAAQIIDAARGPDADIIVIGTRARGPLARAVLGSVAREVLLRAPCSVLVVPSA
jgi:nucleotide-binding universal stress UspA family protein